MVFPAKGSRKATTVSEAEDEVVTEVLAVCKSAVTCGGTATVSEKAFSLEFSAEFARSDTLVTLR